MGADHTAGNTVSMPGNPGDKEGKVEASRNCQIGFALLDNLGLCLFAGAVFEDPANLQHVVDMMAAKFGGSWDIDRLMGLAVQNLTLEKQFNRGAGFTPADDRLPEFFKTEKLPVSDLVFDLTDEELDQVLPM
jgi:aldehyde:ferredoxin oxidoreductase